jgi:hypothetical protein
MASQALKNAISKASVVPGGGVSHVGGATAAQRAPRVMTAAEENARRKPPAGVAPAPAAGSLPWDSAAEGKVANASLQFKGTAEQIAANKALGLQEFGLDPGYNDWKNNPYSQAAILQHNHEANEAGIKVTAGQALYSGQTGNAQGIEAGRRNQAFTGLENEEARAKSRWTGEEQEAAAKFRQEKQEAQEDAIKRRLEAEPEDVPLGGGNSTPRQQGGSKVKKKSKDGKIGISGARKA